MARNVNETEADEATQGAIIEQDNFLAVLHDVNSLKAKGKKIAGDTSARLTKAETQYNLDKRAFSVIASCTRMESTRLNAFLRNFDAYRQYAGLDDMAGTDMFVEVPPPKARARTNGPAATPPKKPRGRPPGKGNRKKKENVERVTFGKQAREPGMALDHESETAGQA
jgi:hypothetical protein